MKLYKAHSSSRAAIVLTITNVRYLDSYARSTGKRPEKRKGTTAKLRESFKGDNGHSRRRPEGRFRQSRVRTRVAFGAQELVSSGRKLRSRSDVVSHGREL